MDYAARTTVMSLQGEHANVIFWSLLDVQGRRRARYDGWGGGRGRGRWACEAEEGDGQRGARDGVGRVRGRRRGKVA